MDELEVRIAAVELVVIELAGVLAHEDAAVVEQAYDAIKAGLEGAGDDDERAVRLAAMKLLDDGLQRYQFGAAGVGLVGKG